MGRNLISSLHEVQQFIEEKPRTQTEIADYFGVDRQTVRRAIDRLSLYTSLTEYKDGRNTVYKFDKQKPFEFTPLEISTLILAQGAIVSSGTESTGRIRRRAARPASNGRAASTTAPPGPNRPPSTVPCRAPTATSTAFAMRRSSRRGIRPLSALFTRAKCSRSFTTSLICIRPT